MANATSKFKVGDRVINKYNQHGTVTEYEGEFVRVRVDGLQYDGGWYESSLRFETPAPTPAPETKLGFTVGQRVRITSDTASVYTSKFGNEGVVTGFEKIYSKYVIRVLTDKGHSGAWYPSSLTLIAPVAPTAAPALTPNQVETLPVPQSKSQAARLSVQTGTQLKYTGQNAAISKNSEVYRIAKNIAVELGRNWKQVNIDMVQGVLVSRGYKAADLGNAAGAIFRGKNWKDTGTTHLSRRESNHARRITVWTYVGA